MFFQLSRHVIVITESHHGITQLLIERESLVIIFQHCNSLIIKLLAKVIVSRLFQIVIKAELYLGRVMVKTNAVLDSKDFPTALLNSAIHDAVISCADDYLNSLNRVQWHQKHVISSEEGVKSHTISMDIIISTFHLESISEDNAIEAEVFFK